MLGKDKAWISFSFICSKLLKQNTYHKRGVREIAIVHGGSNWEEDEVVHSENWVNSRWLKHFLRCNQCWNWEVLFDFFLKYPPSITDRYCCIVLPNVYRLYPFLSNGQIHVKTMRMNRSPRERAEGRQESQQLNLRGSLHLGSRRRKRNIICSCVNRVRTPEARGYCRHTTVQAVWAMGRWAQETVTELLREMFTQLQITILDCHSEGQLTLSSLPTVIRMHLFIISHCIGNYTCFWRNRGLQKSSSIQNLLWDTLLRPVSTEPLLSWGNQSPAFPAVYGLQ